MRDQPASAASHCRIESGVLNTEAEYMVEQSPLGAIQTKPYIVQKGPHKCVNLSDGRRSVRHDVASCLPDARAVLRAECSRTARNDYAYDCHPCCVLHSVRQIIWQPAVSRPAVQL